MIISPQMLLPMKPSPASSFERVPSLKYSTEILQAGGMVSQMVSGVGFLVTISGESVKLHAIALISMMKNHNNNGNLGVKQSKRYSFLRYVSFDL